MKIALLAGEVSGDQIGSILAYDLKKIDPHIELLGVVGERMTASGVRPIAYIDALSVIGLFEVLFQLPRLLWFRYRIMRILMAEKPDIIIGIDAPDFNIGLLHALRRKGFRTMQCVAPTLWAWRPWRIGRLRRAVEHLLALYPFEENWFSSRGIATTYIGHPLAEKIPLSDQTASSRRAIKIDDRDFVIVLLPGSRLNEVHRHSLLLLEVACLLYRELSQSVFWSSIKFIVPLPTRETHEVFTRYSRQYTSTGLPINIMRGHADQAIAAADICLTASGTITLEAALYQKPMVIFYKMNAKTLWVMRKLYRLPWFGLPNILINRSVVPEFLQDAANPETLVKAMLDLIQDPKRRQEIQKSFLELHRHLIQPRQQRLQKVIDQFSHQ